MDISIDELLGKKPNEPTSELETDIDSAIEPAVESSEGVPTIKSKAPVPDGVPVIKSVDTSKDISIEKLLNSAPPVAEDTSQDSTDVDSQTEDALGSSIDPRITALFDAEQLEIQDQIEQTQPVRNEMLDNIFDREMQASAMESSMGPDFPEGMLPRPSGGEIKLLLDHKKNTLKRHEELRNDIQALLDDSNPIRAASVDALLNSGVSLSTIGIITNIADFTPFYGTALGIIDIPENVQISRELWSQGHEGAAALVAGAVFVELGASAIGAKVAINKATKLVKDRAKIGMRIRTATDAELTKKVQKAETLVNDNREFTEKLVEEFELSIDPTGNTSIANVVDGKIVLDTEAARKIGLGISDDVYNLQKEYMDEFVVAVKAKDNAKILELERTTGISANQIIAIAEENAEGFASPLLKAESFNSVVAVAIDLKKKFPKAFDNDKTVIDNLFELTVSDKFDADDLADTLAEYGLNFDQYVLTVVGSGSEAGKILNKLSQIKRAGSFKIDNVQTRELERTQGGIVSAWRRIENIRRGSMTSMLKTAMRNFQSATIRAPMEALENVMDTTLLSMSNEFNRRPDQRLLTRTIKATGRGAQTFVSPSQWAGSLAPLKRIYATPGLSKEITDIILNRPEFAAQHTALFDNVNEYRKRTGAGSGGAVDATLSAVESVVDVLSTPNRIQEYIIRRGVYTGEMERLLKRDWGINMMQALEDGKLGDLIANASSVRPKGARPFDEIVEEATRRALDVTYAKAPDVKLFRETSNFLSRTGLTAVTTPFPRFMFNSMELMGQYSAGAFNPALKRIFNMKKGPLDAKDRQNISRNLSGLAAITAAYQYRISEGAPADYKQIDGQDIGTGEDTVVDVTSQYPMRQFLWIAEAMKRLDPNVQKYLPVSGPLTAVGIAGEGSGTFDDWFDGKDALEVFVGTTARTGTTSVFIDEIANILAGGGEDIVSNERKNRVVGRLLGDYIRTHLIPVTQVVEIQRMIGKRPVEYTDYSTDDPTTIGGEIERSLDQSGVTSIFDPSQEGELPSREFVLSKDRERVGLGKSLFLGLSVLQKNNPDAEYLMGKGIEEFEISSRGKGSVRREENALMREEIPIIVDFAKAVETDSRKQYINESTTYKKQYTLEEHVNAEVLAALNIMIRTTRAAYIGDFKYDTAPEFVELNDQFKRQPRTVRRYALREFYREYDRAPNTTDLNDLDGLLSYAKDLDEFKEGTPTLKRRSR
jgi:hypothetical protein